jgi:hypothetical protein
MLFEKKLEQIIKPEPIKSYIIFGRFIGDHAVVIKPNYFIGVETEPVIESQFSLVGMVTTNQKLYSEIIQETQRTRHAELFYGTKIVSQPSFHLEDGVELRGLDDFDYGRNLTKKVNEEMKKKVEVATEKLKDEQKYWDNLVAISKLPFPSSSQHWKTSGTILNDLKAVCIQRELYPKAGILTKLSEVIGIDQIAYPIIKLPDENI